MPRRPRSAMFRPCLLLAALLLLCSPASAQTVTIRGTVLGHDGRPIPAAHAHLVGSTFGFDAFASVAADAEGRFALTADTTGLVTLQLTGADHQIHRVPLLIEGPGTVELTARLAPNPPADGYDALRIIGDFNDFSFGSGVPMELRAGGTFAATFEAEADTFAYQLLGATGHSNSVNGTAYDRLVYDGGGDYRAVVGVEGDSVTIVFDPQQAVRGEAEAVVTFADPEGRTARVAAVLAEVSAFNDRANAARSEIVQRAQAERETPGAPEITDAMREEMEAAIAALEPDALLAELAAGAEAADSTLRRVYLLSYFDVSGGEKDSTLALAVLREVPPTSPLWAINPRVATVAGAQANTPEADALVRRVLDEHPDPEVGVAVAAALFYEAKREEDERVAAELYAVIQDRFGDTGQARFLKSRYDPDRAIREGQPVPAFAVASLDNPEVTISNETLRGTTYLLDFWATWCGPCVAEMPTLHEVYEDFKGRGFEIVSLSFDGAAEDVAAFREARYPMSWLHGFVEGGFDSDLAKAFEVVGIPKPLLVGPDGTIVATETDLRVEKLRETVAAILGAEGTDSSDEETAGGSAE